MISKPYDPQGHRDEREAVSAHKFEIQREQEPGRTAICRMCGNGFHVRTDYSGPWPNVCPSCLPDL